MAVAYLAAQKRDGDVYVLFRVPDLARMLVGQDRELE